MNDNKFKARIVKTNGNFADGHKIVLHGEIFFRTLKEAQDFYNKHDFNLTVVAHLGLSMDLDCQGVSE